MLDRRNALRWGALVPIGAAAAAATSRTARAAGASFGSLSRADVVSWIEAYGHAWTTKDADAAVALFTPDAEYAAIPGVPEQTYVGSAAIHDYWTSVTAGQSDIVVRHGVPLVHHDRAMVELWVTMRVPALNPDGDHFVTLLETNTLYFAGCNKVERNHEYWNLLMGYVSPPPHWGAESLP